MYKPIIPLFLRSLAESREKRRRTRRNGKKSEKKSVFHDPLSDVAGRRAVPHPQTRTIEFPFPLQTLYSPMVSIPLTDPQNGKGNRNSCFGGRGRRVSFRPLSFFDIEPRKSKGFLLKRIWKQYFSIASRNLALSPLLRPSFSRSTL